ncbi:hypothetical protein ACXX9E_28800 [Pseudomonas sp. GNP014]
MLNTLRKIYNNTIKTCTDISPWFNNLLAGTPIYDNWYPPKRHGTDLRQQRHVPRRQPDEQDPTLDPDMKADPLKLIAPTDPSLPSNDSFDAIIAADALAQALPSFRSQRPGHLRQGRANKCRSFRCRAFAARPGRRRRSGTVAAPGRCRIFRASEGSVGCSTSSGQRYQRQRLLSAWRRFPCATSGIMPFQ